MIEELVVADLRKVLLQCLNNNTNESIINVAIDMILNGVHVNLVSKATGLSVNEILKWYNNKH